MVAYLAGFVLHVVAIWELPLYLAQATVAMSLPVTAVTSMLLHERLQPVHWWAVVLVSAGLVLLSVGSGEPGPRITSPWFAVALWLGVGALLLASRVGLALVGVHPGRAGRVRLRRLGDRGAGHGVPVGLRRASPPRSALGSTA